MILDKGLKMRTPRARLPIVVSLRSITALKKGKFLRSGYQDKKYGTLVSAFINLLPLLEAHTDMEVSWLSRTWSFKPWPLNI